MQIQLIQIFAIKRIQYIDYKRVKYILHIVKKDVSTSFKCQRIISQRGPYHNNLLKNQIDKQLVETKV